MGDYHDMAPANNPNEIQTPKLCTDIIIDRGAGLVVMIERKNDPMGWALPGGFVDIGETVEEAAIREAKEETGLDIELVRQFHVYSDPKQDPRFHTATVVFLAKGFGTMRAGSDAAEISTYHQMNLPENFAFIHHKRILEDYFNERY